jgi:nucleotide-binding universal stress UspA family protein
MVTEAAEAARPVVVGVDGSFASQVALRWAFREASRLGCAMHAVRVHKPHRIIHDLVVGADPENLLEEAVRAAVGPAPYPIPVVRLELTGEPGSALVQASREAALLVVGTHSRDLARRAVLGSVSHYCAQHAFVPVVIVPTSSSDEAERMYATSTVTEPPTEH